MQARSAMWSVDAAFRWQACARRDTRPRGHYLDAGRSVDDILRAFPVLTAADVEAVRTEAVA
jgi:hypothetical protein